MVAEVRRYDATRVVATTVQRWKWRVWWVTDGRWRRWWRTDGRLLRWRSVEECDEQSLLAEPRVRYRFSGGVPVFTFLRVRTRVSRRDAIPLRVRVSNDLPTSYPARITD